MSDKTLLSIAEFGAVRQWLEAVANGHEQTGRFLSGMLDQLESLLADLVRRRSALAMEEEESRQARRRHEEELANQRKALTVLAADAERARQEWERRIADLNAQREALAADETRIRQEQQRRESEQAAQREAFAAEEAQSREEWQRRFDDLKAQRESLAAEEGRIRQDHQQRENELAAQRESLSTEETQLRQDYQRRENALTSQREALAAEEAQSREEWQRRFDDLKTQCESLALERDEIAAQRQSLAAQREYVGPVPHDGASSASIGEPATLSLEPLQPILEGIRQEQSALREMLASGSTQAADLRDAIAHWAVAPEQLLQQVEQIAASAATAATAAPAAPAVDTALAEQLHALELERTVLETELESVRNRAAETSDMLAQQTRQSADERARWAEELKRMRQTIELLAQRPAEPAGPSISDSRPMPSKSAAGGAPATDPVLDSVMAQFEMLQKDLARRRKAGANVHTA